jgi:hypothetical protein
MYITRAGSFVSHWLQLGLSFFKKKIIPRNTEQMDIFMHSVGIPSISRNGKLSEFRSKASAVEKALNSLQNNFVEEKISRNFVISFLTIPRNNKNRCEFIPRNYSERTFDGKPSYKSRQGTGALLKEYNGIGPWIS